MIGYPRRHFATSELDRADQFFRNSVFGDSRKSKLTTQSASGETLYEARLTAELVHNATSFWRQGEKPSNNGRARLTKNQNQEGLKDEGVTGNDKVPKQWYKIKGGLWHRRDFRKFGYGPETGRKNRDPESKRPIRNDYMGDKGKGGPKGQKGRKGEVGKNNRENVASPSVIEFPITQSLDWDICVLYGEILGN